MNPVPDLTAETKPWERVLAKISHFLLYVLIFAMPLTGWMMSSAKNYPVSWFNLFQFPDLVAPARTDLSNSVHDLHHLLFARAGRRRAAARRRRAQASFHRPQRRAEAHVALRRRQVSSHD